MPIRLLDGTGDTGRMGGPANRGLAVQERGGAEYGGKGWLNMVARDALGLRSLDSFGQGRRGTLQIQARM